MWYTTANAPKRATIPDNIIKTSKDNLQPHLFDIWIQIIYNCTIFVGIWTKPEVIMECIADWTKVLCFN